MRIDFSRQFFDLDGDPIKDNDGKTAVTLGKVAATALLGTFEEETTKPDGAEKVRRFNLAKRVAKGGEHDISPEECALIRKLIAWGYVTMITGQAWEMLE